MSEGRRRVGASCGTRAWLVSATLRTRCRVCALRDDLRRDSKNCMIALTGPDDQQLYSILCLLLAGALLVTLLVAAVGVLRSTRPGLAIGIPIAVAAAARVSAAAVVSSSERLSSLPGPDESSFLSEARKRADLDWASWIFGEVPDVLLKLAGGLNVELLALQFQVLGTPGEFSLRVVQIAVGVFGICIIAAAVHDLAGPRAALIVAWLLAFEPANVFYSGVLNRESLVVLGEALVLLGSVRMWQRRDVSAGALILVGCTITMATRSYAGGLFLLAGGAITLHAALKRTGGKERRTLPLAMTVGAAGALLLVVAALYSSSILEKLQSEQDAYTADTSNLALEPIDFSSPAAVAVNLPRRVRDFLIRPYPWQAANLSQGLGVIGALVCWGLIFILVLCASLDWRGACRRAGPIPYLIFAVLLSYSLAAANAGTGFRYRSHLVVFLAAAAATVLAPRWPMLTSRLTKLRHFSGRQPVRHER